MSKYYDLMQQAGIGLGDSVSLPNGAKTTDREEQNVKGSELVLEAPASIREESFKLVQRLFLTSDPALLPKSVVFAAVDADSVAASSLVCAIAAQALAENVSGSVCLVRANLRTPEVFATDHGFADSLRQGGGIRGFVSQKGRDNFWVLSTGSQPENSINLVNSDKMRERMAELRREFSFVLVDVPAFGVSADGMALGRLSDGVVLVLEAHSTRREAAVRIADNLRMAGIPVLGAVLNNRTFPIPAALYKRL